MPSGCGSEHDVQRAREAGFVEHLTKPVDLNTLFALIARVSKLVETRRGS